MARFTWRIRQLVLRFVGISIISEYTALRGDPYAAGRRRYFHNAINTRCFIVPPPPPPETHQLTCTGRPSFYQFLRQIPRDRHAGVLWDSEVPLTRVPSDEPHKVKIVYGPSRSAGEEHLPADCGTNWGLKTGNWNELKRIIHFHRFQGFLC